MFLLSLLLLSLVSCQSITDASDVMQQIVSKAEYYIKTDPESQVFSMISSDFKAKGINVLERRSNMVLENSSTVYQEAALAQRDLINICKSYKRDLVKRDFGIKGILGDVGAYLASAVLMAGFFLILRFFYSKLSNSTDISKEFK